MCYDRKRYEDDITVMMARVPPERMRQGRYEHYDPRMPKPRQRPLLVRVARRLLGFR